MKLLIISEIHANWPALRAYAATPFPDEVIGLLAHVLRTGRTLPQKTTVEALL